jgi:glucosamine--fructose-6-phosphate aminotransferase (isomerizing)
MVEPEMLVLAIAPEGEGLQHSKSVSNIEEVKARKGTLLSLLGAGDAQLRKVSDDAIEIPSAGVTELLAILAVLPLQLFAYYVAVAKGTEVDQPRNLAKSVTVE